ncbi:HNH endonuclease family protein [Nocardioides caeni]|uniref:DUF262 domain-containing protein n=1 Tax=Nocardioides caeni TaxID=574700 RepID=A0A4S8N380_9ACTN|nr:DUF262 domain-containing protein [Nocardioides caeni]THV10460.1 DUF262 domain-containing protein [Nocardioides caeni]
MEIDLKRIKIRDLVEAYEDNDEAGVTGYDGNLDIRPAYQREFVYKDKQRAAVIETVRKKFPLNVMYWAVNVKDGEPDGTFEVIDGQQRTISICQYVEGDFSIEIDGHQMAFHNLQDDQQEQILDYELMVYLCEGTDSEKLDWFKTINIAGEKLTNQELRNAVYHGPWVSAAKRYFSKTGCPAYQIASDYMSGSPIRQDYLETAIEWINDGKVDEYMRDHQDDSNANELWLYFKGVIDWVETTFPKKRSEMKSVKWGPLYNTYKDVKLDPAELEKQVSALMADPDVTSNRGAYEYVLTGDENKLSIRAFDDRMRRTAYEQQKGICPGCGKHFEIEQMQADHKTPWSKGGKTVAENCVMLCQPCNRKKWDV